MFMHTDVKEVAWLTPSASSSFGRRWKLGTVSLNHGDGDRSSANQSAVAVPASFVRVWTWHSWKWTPASGWFAAKSSNGAQVFLSHSEAAVPRTDTLVRC